MYIYVTISIVYIVYYYADFNVGDFFITVIGSERYFVYRLINDAMYYALKLFAKSILVINIYAEIVDIRVIINYTA